MSDRTPVGCWVMSALAISGFGFYVFTAFQANKVHRSEQQLARSAAEADSLDVLRFVEQHGAIDPWPSDTAAGRRYRDALTWELQDSLVREDGRPILVRGRLTDIVRNGDTLTAFFDGAESVRYALRVTAEQAVQLSTGHATDPYAAWVVIARVQRLSRPVFSLRGETEYDEDASFGYVSVDDFAQHLAWGIGLGFKQPRRN